MVGELLLSLAVTFAAQNAMVWARAKRLKVDQARSAIPSRNGRT